MTENLQKDLVLSINEYSYVLDETKGHVSCLVGPTKMSLSQSDKLVLFDPISKSFVPCPTMDRAKNLFTCAPENWYVILKNPVEGGRHPQTGASNSLPENVLVGQKVNIRGPVNFALYPGQMAKVVKGHALRSNQYLLARVYEAESANANQGEILDVEGNKVENQNDNKYINGQILVIKGTEISFYIPPTGIEVIPVKQGEYIREAVTLERLEYCILKDENGSKRYVHGPQVVFPEPTEDFVPSSKGNVIFKAIELSKISGIYVKVIAEYTDENNVVHPVGEEMFITGNEQMIYYPRPEHAIISYDNKIVHHAIAIPRGEGRYVMNRLTGDIRTVHGPAMLLPDPRTEVIVKRKLSPKQAALWYPGNKEVAEYNAKLDEKYVEKSLKSINVDSLNTYCSTTAATMDMSLTGYTSNAISAALSNTDPFAMDALESKASVSRGTSYTKPRTITLDNKFDGVVSIEVWTGYAVNVVSKNGDRRVVVGPQTIILDYDETLEVVKDKVGQETVFLPYKNVVIKDKINAMTSDYVEVAITLNYVVNFDEANREDWFVISDYSAYLRNKMNSMVRELIKRYTVQEVYHSYYDIIMNMLNEEIIYNENGMTIDNIDILNFAIDSDEVAEMFEKHQEDIVSKELELIDSAKMLELTEQQVAINAKVLTMQANNALLELKLRSEEEAKKRELKAIENREIEAERVTQYQAKLGEADIRAQVEEKTREMERLANELKAEHEAKMIELEAKRKEIQTEAAAKIMQAIGPDLVAAMNNKSNSELVSQIVKSLSPYALAGDYESASDVVNKLVRGTGLEELINGVNLNI